MEAGAAPEHRWEARLAPLDLTDHRQKVADRPGSPAAAPAATEAVSSPETAALGYF